MPYSEKLAHRIREALADLPDVEEKKMFRGITFMVNGKMCISVSGDEIMCRIDPAGHDAAMEQNGAREMLRGGKAMRGFVYIPESELKTKKNLDSWINLCLNFNAAAKATKKRK